MKPYEQNYEILSELGSGGMSKVYLVRHKRLDTLWAMKEVRKHTGVDFDLLGEANVLKRLNHPALPRIVDVYDEPDSFYIIEDYIEGSSVDRLLQEKGRLSEKQVRDIAMQLCDVLEYLHTQRPNPIIYRDMKPSNIMITADGGIKLIDFGIAREHKAAGASDTTLLGTHGYAAPEQFGMAQSDARTDIYSMGVTLYHMITGVNPNDPPYVLKPIREWVPSLSKRMERIIARCTQAQPEKRFQTVSEVKRALESKRDAVIKEKPAKAGSSVPVKARPADILKLAGCLLVIAAGVFMVVFGGMKNDAQLAYDQQYAEGVRLIKLREFQQAQSILTEADASAKRWDGSAAMITAMAEAGYMEECAAFAADAARAHPALQQDPEVNCSWGMALESLKDYAGALEKFTLASEQSPDNLLYIGHLARAYANCGDIEAANLQVQRMAAASDEASAAFVRAGILNVSGEYEAAMAHYAKCAEGSADNSLRFAAYKEIAELCKRSRGEGADYAGYLDAQINALEQMRQLFPNKDEAYVLENLGQAHYLKGTQEDHTPELESALACFQSLVRLGYGRASTYVNMSVIQRRLKEYPAAEESLRALLDKYPGNADAYLELALVAAEREGEKEQEKRDYADVLKYYELALQHGAKGEKRQRLEGIIEDIKSGGWL